MRETPPPTYTERGGGRDKGARSDTLISALTKFLSTVHRLWPQMLSYKISMESDNLGKPEVIVKVPAHCNHDNLYSPYYWSSFCKKRKQQQQQTLAFQSWLVQPFPETTRKKQMVKCSA